MKVQGRAVLIRPENMPEKTKAGVTIPKTAKNTLNEGMVIDCGPECEITEVGKKVKFLRKNTSIMDIDGVEHCFGIESCIQYVY